MNAHAQGWGGNLASLLAQAGPGMSGSQESRVLAKDGASESTAVCTSREAHTVGTFPLDVKHMYWIQYSNLQCLQKPPSVADANQQ